MEDYLYTVYKVTNKVNGKFYVGIHKTKNLEDGYMGSGNYITRAIRKYGVDNFDKHILFVFDNPEDMFSKEAEIVNEDFIADKNTYNLKIGGFGGWDYINSYGMNNWDTFSPESKKNCINQLKSVGRLHSFRYRHNSNYKRRVNEQLKNGYEKWKRNNPEAPGPFKGRRHTDLTKSKMRVAVKGNQKGSKNSQFGTKWITNGFENKKVMWVDSLPDGWYYGRTL